MNKTNIDVRLFNKDDFKYINDAAELLKIAFPEAYAYCALEEVHSCLVEDNIAMMAILDSQLVGFIGAIPQYGKTGWELYPLVVDESHQFKGIGSLLLQSLEYEVASNGGITIYLGTDDEFNQTSLSGVDLYKDTYTKIENIQNTNNHPYEFYMKHGYKIVGVIPDANGIGKPDIMMAKRIVK